MRVFLKCLFVKARHLDEFHIASGIGFELIHNAHIVMGTILMTISVVAIAVLAFVYNRAKQQETAE